VLEERAPLAALRAARELAAARDDFTGRRRLEAGVECVTHGTARAQPGRLLGGYAQLAQPLDERAIDTRVGGTRAAERCERREHAVGQLAIVEHGETARRSTNDINAGGRGARRVVDAARALVSSERQTGRRPGVEADDRLACLPHRLEQR